MDEFYQAVACVLLTVIVAMALDGHAGATSRILVILVSIMVLTAGIRYFRPVMNFLRTLSHMTGLQEEIIFSLMKTLGIAVTSEIAVLICNDSGHSSLGKALQMMANGIILWLSLPMFQGLLDLLQKLMEAL